LLEKNDSTAALTVTRLRCDGVVHNQIKKGFAECVSGFFLIGKYLAKLQACNFARLANTLLKDEESARDNHVFACNFAKYSPILIFFHSQTQQ